jgi:GNAT superfamily N-acetyltransferase
VHEPLRLSIGRFGLVAAVSGPEDALVAEAGYAILPDGDGEFALTVAPGCRGWRLGRYLLDAIVAAAAARGVRLPAPSDRAWIRA